MKVDIKKIKDAIQSEELVFVEFWGSWCPPCQMMKSTLKEFEKEYQDKIKILKVNTDLNPSVSEEYIVRGLPTFILFKNGKEIKREVGAKSKEQLISIIKDEI